MTETIDSKFMANDLGISQRTANYMRAKDDFPSVFWIGRRWVLERTKYENWKENNREQ